MAKQSNPRGLGRGFDVLIPTGFDSSIIENDDKPRIKTVLIGSLQPNPDQPRKHFDTQELELLAASIKHHGVLQPLIVTDDANADGYTIIAGERRWRASQLAGLTEVPVIVRTIKELEKLEIGLIENVQRVDLSPLEQAASMTRLHNEFNISWDDIATRIGKAVSTVSNTVRLLQLPVPAQQALHAEQITEGHARAILALKADEARQLDLLELILRHGWSVRQAEAYVTAVKQGTNVIPAPKKRAAIQETPQTEKLGRYLKASVVIKPMAKGGKLQISYKSDADLERILDQLTKESSPN